MKHSAPKKKPAARKGPPKKKSSAKSAGKSSRTAKAKGVKAPAKRAAKPKVAKKRAALPVEPNPRAEALAQKIAQLALEKKASEVVVLDVRGKTSYADYVVVASGDSERQVSAVAEHIETSLKKAGERTIGSEGRDTGNWVLLDYGEVVVHLFYAEQRAFYDLEGLWADAPRQLVADIRA